MREALVGFGTLFFFFSGNQEDLSIYSEDQATTPEDPWSGGRALLGCVRPHPYVVQGEVLSMRFKRLAGKFVCTIRSPPVLVAGSPEAVGTIFYIPQLQFPGGFVASVAGDPNAVVVADEAAQRLIVAASLPNNVLHVAVVARQPINATLTERLRAWL